MSWKKILLVLGLAWLVVAGSLMVLGGMALGWVTLSAARHGELTTQQVARTISLPSVDPATQPAGAAPEPLRITVELQEGDFDIRPGPAGADLTVNGAYAASYYELVEDVRADADGGVQEVRVTLRPTASSLARAIASLRADHDHAQTSNRLTVTIPRDRPLALALRVGRGTSDIELGGLTLTSIDIDLSMGDHWVAFTDPLVGDVRSVTLTGSMGGISVDHLGNARAHHLALSSSMGEFTGDLGGQWRQDVEPKVHVQHAMGELTLRIPVGVRLGAGSSTSVQLGQNRHSDQAAGTAAPDAPVVELHVSTTMGDAQIVRY